MSVDRSDHTLSTYRHLRLAMVLLLALLFIAVGHRAMTVSAGLCFEGSISAYYFTSARAVFVATLCAIGTCLIVYRGNSDREDVALNASGALAFVVAFVPTGAPSTTGVRCSASNVPTPAQLDAAVDNNVVSLIIVSAIAIAAALFLLRGERHRGSTATRALWLFLAALVVGAGAFKAWPAGFRSNAHSTSAIFMFIGILLVVGLNAWGAAKTDEEPNRARKYRNIYGGIATGMFLTGAGLGVAHWQVSGWRHGVLFIEADLLLWFMAFWMTQTVELWNRLQRDDAKIVAE